MTWGYVEISCAMMPRPKSPGKMDNERDHPSGKGDPDREGKTMVVMGYRTQDGLADYGFSIDFLPRIGWRVYIIFQPFHQSDDDSLHLPYQAVDGDGRRYVDWSGKLDNLGDAKTVAALWAELVQGYRRAQEQRALIERYRRTQERRRATPAEPDRLGGDAVDAGAAGPGHQDGGPVIPHPRASAESFSDLPESA
jgi:hypothetical protein